IAAKQRLLMPAGRHVPACHAAGPIVASQRDKARQGAHGDEWMRGANSICRNKGGCHACLAPQSHACVYFPQMHACLHACMDGTTLFWSWQVAVGVYVYGCVCGCVWMYVCIIPSSALRGRV